MASLNKVTLIGNLGRDPEIKTFDNGGKVANIAIATTEKWRDKTSGENREATEWHNVSFSGPLADVVAKYLKKGSSVYIEGSLRTRKWTDKNGENRYATEIRANSMQMLGGAGGKSAQQENAASNANEQAQQSSYDSNDIPF